MNFIKYKPNEDLKPVDRFAPRTEKENEMLTFPEEANVYFIKSENDLTRLMQLVGTPYVGIDSEWRPTISKLDAERPALMQLSDG